MRLLGGKWGWSRRWRDREREPGRLAGRVTAEISAGAGAETDMKDHVHADRKMLVGGAKPRGYNTFEAVGPTGVEKSPAISLPLGTSSLPSAPSTLFSSIHSCVGRRAAQRRSFWSTTNRMTRFALATAIFLISLIALTKSAPWVHNLNFVARELALEKYPPVPPPNDHLIPTKAANLTEYDADTWTLGTRKFIPNTYQVQPYVANGYHGSRLTAEGAGYWQIQPENGERQPIQGWPLDNPRQTFATIAGFWDSQLNTTRTNFPELIERHGESVISGIPTWSSFVIATADGQHAYTPGVPKEQIEEYHQTASLRDDIVTTTVKWRPVKGGPAYTLVFTVVAHQVRINLGMMRIDITSNDGDSDLIITDILDGRGAQRTVAGEKAIEPDDDIIWTSVHPMNLTNISAYEFSALDFGKCKVVEGSRKEAAERFWVSKHESTVSREYMLKATKGKPLTILKYVGIASSDASKDPKTTSRNAALEAKKCGWDKLLKQHRDAWNALWEDADIIIPGMEMETLQISMRASLHNLLANVRPGEEGPGIGDNSVSVGGLASDSYGGLVFWDADLWMQHGLQPLHPERAASINNYRQRLLPQAQENAKENHLTGALYPWTSARFGKCTGTGPCMDYQYHLNTDIALEHWNEFLTTGNMTWLRENGWPIIKEVAEMWTGLVIAAPEDGNDGLKRGMYTVNNMTDPDEYANHVNNGAFTNAGVKVVMRIAQEAAEILGVEYPEKFQDVYDRMFIPFNSEAMIIPEFANMNGSVTIKQADVVLINYPLGFRLNEQQALNDLDYYARAQSPDGPAMSWAIYANSALDLSPHGCASFSYMLLAYQPYLREPYYQYSEQVLDNVLANGNTNPAFTFLTGHGGLIQIATHGFTGFRPELDAFFLDPSIPPQITDGVTVKGMKFQDAVFDVQVLPYETKITCKKTKYDGNPTKVRVSNRNPKGGDYNLKQDEVLIIPTRRPDLNGTDIPGNKAECKPCLTTSPIVPGQYATSAVDGSNHTQWRPHSPAPAELIVDLGEINAINQISINWGKWPPKKWTVYALNSSSIGWPSGSYSGSVHYDLSLDWKLVHHTDHIAISDPWVWEPDPPVRRTIGNFTVVDLDEGSRTTARWVKLVIEGDRTGTGAGGTVSQFAIL